VPPGNMTFALNVSRDPISHQPLSVRLSLCFFLSCIGPGAHGLCFQLERLNHHTSSRIRQSNRTPNGQIQLNRNAQSNQNLYYGSLSQHLQPNFYIFSPLLAAPYQIPESPAKKKETVCSPSPKTRCHEDTHEENIRECTMASAD